MKKLSSLILLLSISFTLAGCNTVEGFGKDLQKVGSDIENEADKDGGND